MKPKAKPSQEPLPVKLRILRAKEGLYVSDAAKKLGIGRDTLSDLEHGARLPSMVTLKKIADGYGVPVEDLLGAAEEGSGIW